MNIKIEHHTGPKNGGPNEKAPTASPGEGIRHRSYQSHKPRRGGQPTSRPFNYQLREATQPPVSQRRLGLWLTRNLSLVKPSKALLNHHLLSLPVKAPPTPFDNMKTFPSSAAIRVNSSPFVVDQLGLQNSCPRKPSANRRQVMQGYASLCKVTPRSEMQALRALHLPTVEESLSSIDPLRTWVQKRLRPLPSSRIKVNQAKQRPIKVSRKIANQALISSHRVLRVAILESLKTIPVLSSSA